MPNAVDPNLTKTLAISDDRAREFDAYLASQGFAPYASARQRLRETNPTAFAPRRVPVVRAVEGWEATGRVRIGEFCDVFIETRGACGWVEAKRGAWSGGFAKALANTILSALKAADADGMEPAPVIQKPAPPEARDA